MNNNKAKQPSDLLSALSRVTISYSHKKDSPANPNGPGPLRSLLQSLENLTKNSQKESASAKYKKDDKVLLQGTNLSRSFQEYITKGQKEGLWKLESKDGKYFISLDKSTASSNSMQDIAKVLNKVNLLSPIKNAG